MKNKIWQNLSNQTFYKPIEQLVEEAILQEKSLGNEIIICVGSDSQAYRAYVHYATAVMVVRKGKGAYAYFQREKVLQQLSIKERLLAEVYRSVEVAYAICGLLETHAVELEVHVDINTDTHFKSNTALKEAMGYILGMGFTFKAKPEAFASSSCADMVV